MRDRSGNFGRFCRPSEPTSSVDALQVPGLGRHRRSAADVTGKEEFDARSRRDGATKAGPAVDSTGRFATVKYCLVAAGTFAVMVAIVTAFVALYNPKSLRRPSEDSGTATSIEEGNSAYQPSVGSQLGPTSPSKGHAQYAV